MKKPSEIFETSEASGYELTKSDAHNVTYHYIAWGKTVVKTVVVSDHCNVDLDEDGYPVGVEII